MTESRRSIKELILVPSLITLAITVLRLVGELQNWAPTLFNKAYMTVIGGLVAGGIAGAVAGRKS